MRVDRPVGAIAVVATLGYLAVQIRQSNRASQQTAIQSFYESISTASLEPMRDIELLQLFRRGCNDWEGLSKNEQARLHCYWSDYFSKLHMGYRLYESQVLPEASYEGWETFIVMAPQTPAAHGVWSAGRSVFPSDFTARIERRLGDDATRPPSLTDVYAYFRTDRT